MVMSSSHLLQTSYLFFVGTASFVGIHPSGSGKRMRRLHGRNATTTSGSSPRTCWGKAVRHRHLQPSRLARPTHVYESSPHLFDSPSWMPSASLPKPDSAMEMAPISEKELARVIRKSKPSSAPSHVDRIPYLIFKKCPSLRPALLDLFNRVIMEGSVPSS